MSEALPPRYEQLGRAPRTPAARARVEVIVAAARRCWDERGYDAVGVEDICHEAGIGISSFYARFASKEELLELVHTRYLDELEADLRTAASEVSWSGHDLDGLVATVLARFLEHRRRHAGEFRTMAIAELRHPGLAGRREHADRRAMEALATLVVPDDAHESTRRELSRRLSFLGRVVNVVFQDLTAFRRGFPEATGLTDDDVVRYLTEISRSFLGPTLGAVGRSGDR